MNPRQAQLGYRLQHIFWNTADRYTWVSATVLVLAACRPSTDYTPPQLPEPLPPEQRSGVTASARHTPSRILIVGAPISFSAVEIVIWRTSAGDGTSIPPPFYYEFPLLFQLALLLLFATILSGFAVPFKRGSSCFKE